MIQYLSYLSLSYQTQIILSEEHIHLVKHWIRRKKKNWRVEKVKSEKNVHQKKKKRSQRCRDVAWSHTWWCRDFARRCWIILVKTLLKAMPDDVEMKHLVDFDMGAILWEGIPFNLNFEFCWKIKRRWWNGCDNYAY